jgi:hypothetical protein
MRSSRQFIHITSLAGRSRPRSLRCHLAAAILCSQAIGGKCFSHDLQILVQMKEPLHASLPQPRQEVLKSYQHANSLQAPS